MTISIYAPDSEARPDVGRLSTPRLSLAGLRIAVLDNGKANADTVMTRAAETLAARTGAVVALVVKKGPGGRSANAAIPCDADVFEQVVASADIVITGAADCGSCTAYSVYDAISFEKVGVPAVVVTTTKFEPIANRMSSDFGMPNVRTLVLPHPLGGTDRDTLWRWADAAVEQLEALFTGSPPTPDSVPITRALDQVRAIVQADGSDLELVGATDETVWLRLVIEDASCADCVMPKDILEATALRMMQVEVPAITRVDIDDPRAR